MIRGFSLLSGILCSALLLAGCSASGDDGAAERSSPSLGSEWDEKAGAPEAAAFMKIDVPSGATEVKGAVAVNPQEDVYLLSFVTAESTAERIAKDLHSPAPLSPDGTATRGTSMSGLFEHLGLTPPEKLRSVRWAGVCPPCVEHNRGQVQWIEIYVHTQAEGRARVYLQAF